MSKLLGRSEIQWGRSDIQWGRSEIQWGRSDIQWGRSEIQWGRSEIQWGRSDFRWGRSDFRWGRSDFQWGRIFFSFWRLRIFFGALQSPKFSYHLGCGYRIYGRGQDFFLPEDLNWKHFETGGYKFREELEGLLDMIVSWLNFSHANNEVPYPNRSPPRMKWVS